MTSDERRAVLLEAALGAERKAGGGYAGLLAVIDVVLEEAATIIERRATIRHGYDAHFDAAAIRAMIPKEPA